MYLSEQERIYCSNKRDKWLKTKFYCSLMPCAHTSRQESVFIEATQETRLKSSHLYVVYKGKKVTSHAGL